MKNLLVAFLFCLFFASPVFADWKADFETTYLSQGIEQAVADALAEGGSLDAIFAEAQKIPGLDIQALLLALYCAALNTNDIEKAAIAANIPESLLTAAYEQAQDECPQFIGIPRTTSDSRNITYRGTFEPGTKPPPPPPPKPTPEPVPPPSSPDTF